MTYRATRQIALIALLATCMTFVILILASGLEVKVASAMHQALPLVAVGCIALAVLFFFEPTGGER